MLLSAVIICDNRNTIILALSCDRINIRILWENNTLNKIAIKITEFELKKNDWTRRNSNSIQYIIKNEKNVPQ
jgi:hypothetical protein